MKPGILLRTLLASEPRLALTDRGLMFRTPRGPMPLALPELLLLGKKHADPIALTAAWNLAREGRPCTVCKRRVPLSALSRGDCRDCRNARQRAYRDRTRAFVPSEKGCDACGQVLPARAFRGTAAKGLRDTCRSCEEGARRAVAAA
jgi:hypothetical protein